MRRHKKVTALLREAEWERRCALGDRGALYHALRRRVKAGELTSPYRNLYAGTAYWNSLDAEERSLHVIRALAKKHPSWTFAGVSAACLYGFEHSYAVHDGKVHIACSSGAGDGDCELLERTYMPSSVMCWRCAGILVTSPARTLVDCARLPFPNALQIYDSALRWGRVDAAEVKSLMIRVVCDEEAVAKLLRYADPLSENGGESLMRAGIIELGFAVPRLQVEFDNPDNPQSPYRVDCCWRLADGRVIVAEYDGMAKYADAGNMRRASLRAKLDYERRREVHLRNQGVGPIVHVCYEDVMHAEELESKLTSAGVPRLAEVPPLSWRTR